MCLLNSDAAPPPELISRMRADLSRTGAMRTARPLNSPQPHCRTCDRSRQVCSIRFQRRWPRRMLEGPVNNPWRNFPIALRRRLPFAPPSFSRRRGYFDFLSQAGGARNGLAEFTESLQMTLDGLPNVPLCLFKRASGRDTSRQIGNVGCPIALPLLKNYGVFLAH